MTQEKIKQSEKEALEKERLKYEAAKQKEVAMKEDEMYRLEEEKKKLAMKFESATTTSVLLNDNNVSPGHEIENLNDFGKLIILGLDQMNYGFLLFINEFFFND